VLVINVALLTVQTTQSQISPTISSGTLPLSYQDE
jgi:hypothetical protein